jgi:hypothetical protein
MAVQTEFKMDTSFKSYSNLKKNILLISSCISGDVTASRG